MTTIILLKNIHPDPRSANVMDEARLEKLTNSIKYTGCMQPIIVRKHPEKAKHYIVIDGHQRIKAVKALNRKEVSAEVWDVDDKKATLLLASINQLRGEDHPYKRAELINDLLSDFDRVQLATLIPESVEQIDDLVDLLAQDEQKLTEALVEHIKKEQDALPQTLTFILSAEDVQLVKVTLDGFDTENHNLALVSLCNSLRQA